MAENSIAKSNISWEMFEGLNDRFYHWRIKLRIE